MNKIMFILILGLIIVVTLISKSFIYVIAFCIWIGAIQVLKIINRKKIKNIENKNLLDDFHNYLKVVILLTYTRPLKIAFVDAKKTDNELLNKYINKFISDIQYDFTVEPYKKLALNINPVKIGINYEINIMYLLYEFEKKGLGSEYISDILVELDLLIDNQVDADIEELRDTSYMYSLPPTIINFFYLTIVLFNVINLMIENILNG